MEKELIWKRKDLEEKEIESFCDEYKAFLTQCKTERECVSYFVDDLRKAGAKSIEEMLASKKAPKAGDIIYLDMMHKALVAFKIGTKPLTEGLRLLGAHIDSPRLDLKPNPLYEDNDFAFLDTHYYGGIKKYQWVTTPLAMHGVVAKTDGTVIDVVIGEDITDPVISITDVLPHLGKAQQERKLGEAIPGEELDLLVGSIPIDKDEKDPVKANILSILKCKYGIEEKDFLSAELEIVPAGAARDHGLDRSMIMAYGQDDRICAFTSYKAFMDITDNEYTTVCLCTDKEEIGSVGATGAHSRFFEDAVADVFDACGVYSELNLRRAFKKTKVLSSDVNAAFDPHYAEVMEKKNAAYAGCGPVISKYTGQRGKSGSNDANAEFVAYLRGALEDNGVYYQMAELGKVDEGGGGTIAYILANLGMEVIDFGTAILSMHAPYELSSKADVYETYRAYKAFLTR